MKKTVFMRFVRVGDVDIKIILKDDEIIERNIDIKVILELAKKYEGQNITISKIPSASFLIN